MAFKKFPALYIFENKFWKTIPLIHIKINAQQCWKIMNIWNKSKSDLNDVFLCIGDIVLWIILTFFYKSQTFRKVDFLIDVIECCLIKDTANNSFIELQDLHKLFRIYK